jgi:hypothetical protein
MVFKAFGMGKYITNATMVDLKKCKCVRWNINPFGLGTIPYENADNYDYIDLVDSPHYKLLEGDKALYIDYISKIDLCHSDMSKFENLINNFNYENYGSCNRLIQVCNINGETVITDGLHRAAIILKRNAALESVVVRSIIIKNELYK